MLCLVHFFLYIKNCFLHIFWGYFIKYEFRIIIIFSWELKVLFRNTFIDLFVGSNSSYFQFFFDNVFISPPFLKDTFSGCTILWSSHFSTLRMISIIFIPLFYIWVPSWILYCLSHQGRVLQSIPLQRVTHDLVAEQQPWQTQLTKKECAVLPASPRSPTLPHLHLLTHA